MTRSSAVTPAGWAVLAVVGLGTFMTALDASIVNISLPSIARTFHTPVDGTVQWVIIAYLVVVAATLMTFGRLADLVGRKPLWMSGLAVFTLGSIFCGAAGSVRELIAARVFQGLGGALIFAPAFAIITDTFLSSERGRALAVNAVVVAVATSLGPTPGCSGGDTTRRSAGGTSSLRSARPFSDLERELIRRSQGQFASRWRPGILGPDAPSHDRVIASHDSHLASVDQPADARPAVVPVIATRTCPEFPVIGPLPSDEVDFVKDVMRFLLQPRAKRESALQPMSMVTTCARRLPPR